MSFLPVELIPYVKYATPPIVGAFIGYLTNRVAIRMLFRPLKAWRIFGLRVPMTPGVIPSKRGELAENMGEMVGDHLLTSKEIGKALKEEKFQKHLLSVIAERVGAILHKDLGPLPDLVPKKFTIYFDIAIKTVKFQLKENIHSYIRSPEFERKVEDSLEHRLDLFLARDVGSVLTGQEREVTYRFIEDSISRMLSSQAMEQWIEEFVQQKVYGALQQQKSLAEVLPESLVGLMADILRQQTPNLMKKLTVIARDQEVREKIVSGACEGVDKFIDSLGSMSAMARNFLSMETVEEKVREYLDEKEDDIAAWLESEELQIKIASLLAERFVDFCDTPVVNIVDSDDATQVEGFCKQLSGQLAIILQGEEITTALSSMIKGNMETHIEGGATSIRSVLTDFVGVDGVKSGKLWIRGECVALLRSKETLKTLDSMIETMVDTLLKKRIGKLSNVLPSKVRAGIYQSIRKMASDMLAIEVPGLVDSLDIRTIIAKKINTLDLLSLERLLLSIMEEQFKYINLFGALLGFLIGCLNLIFLYGT